MNTHLRSLIILAFACLFFTASTQAEEHILDYDTYIVVQPDGVLDITETITVDVQHDKINRGIYRDFPIVYSAPSGGHHEVGFTLLDVQRDMQPEPYRQVEQGGGLRIYIGNPNKLVEIGTQVYSIHYQTDRQLQFFEDRTELYFNAIPHGFEFPIDKANMRVRLPDGASILRHTAFTGEMGSKANNTNVQKLSPSEIHFETSTPLEAFQGVTIVLAMDKQSIQAPSEAQLQAWFWQDYGVVLESLAALIGFLLFLFLLWLRVGKDPKKGTIIPRFKAPTGLSPAVCHYFVNRSVNYNTFAVALLSLVVKGAILIKKIGVGYRLDKLDKSGAKTTGRGLGLSQGEAIIYTELFKDKASISLGGTYRPELANCYGRYKNNIRSEFEKENFKHNYSYIYLALVVFIGVFFSLIFRHFGMGQAFILTVFSCLISAVFSVLLLLVVSLWKKKSYFFAVASAVIFFPSLGLFGAFVLSGMDSVSIFSPAFSLTLCSMLAVAAMVLFTYIISAPTPAGQRLLDEIEGFKWYLSVAEGDDLKGMRMPEATPELYERFLPYALALGVENAWTQRFASVVADSAVDPSSVQQTNTELQHTSRYGSSSRALELNKLATGLGSGLSRAVSTSSTPPSTSSSGSSGFSSGGSSGGGGGGGGGGGW